MSAFEDPLYKDWVRAALGLKYLKEGIYGFVDQFAKQHHSNLLQSYIKGCGSPATSCTECTSENLMPDHPRHQCIQKFRSKCFCNNPVGRRKCPNNFCSLLYDLIVIAHDERNPLWINTDPRKWYSDHWEIAKCYLSTTGYSEQGTAVDTDAAGLLSIIVNNIEIRNYVDCIDNIKKVRDIRNDIMHSKSFQVDQSSLYQYIDRMILVLQDPKILVTDVAAQNAVIKLEKLKKNQIHISLDDAYEMRRQTLKAVEDGKKEIEKTKDEGIQQIEKKGKEMLDDLDSHFDQRLLEQNKSKEISDVETVNSDLTEDEKALQRYLLEFYKKEYVQIQISPLSTKKRENVEELYVPLQAKIFSKLKNEATTKLADVFQQDNKVMHSIYVTGEAGIGKSTFCRKLISLWCTVRENDAQLPHDYTPVFDFETQSSTENTEIQSLDEFDNNMEDLFYEYESDSYSDDSSLCDQDLSTDTTENAFPSFTSNQDPVNSVAIKSQINDSVKDNASIQKFYFLFFISLRDTAKEVSIEAMVENQLLFQKSRLVECFKSTIDRIPEKCLFILDGLDEWSQPKPHPTHPTVTRGLPLSTVSGKYVKLFTTRRWKYESLNPCIEEHESEVILTGIGKTASKTVIEKMLVSKYQSHKFEKAACLSDTYDLWTIPLLLKLLICVWKENSKLERSKTELYSSMINIMLHLAEKRNDLNTGILTYQLPQMLEVFRYIKDNSNFIVKLAQFAFYSLFEEPYGSSVVFSEFYFLKQGLSSKEILQFLKTGILTQKSISSQFTFTPNTSLSFIHKSFQEYFAAVYIAFADSDKNKIRKLIVRRCGKTYQILEMANVFYFLADLRQDLYQDVLKEIALHYRGISLGNELDLTLKLKEKDSCLIDIFLRGNPKTVLIESINYGLKGNLFSSQNQQLQILELRSVSMTLIEFKRLLEGIPMSGTGVDVTLICIGWIDEYYYEIEEFRVQVQNVGKLKIEFTNLTKVEFILPQNICTVEFTENDMTDNALRTMINSVSTIKGENEMTFHRIKLRKSKSTHCNSDCPFFNITVNACEVNKSIEIGKIKICKSDITHTGTCSDLQNVQLRELTIERVDLANLSFSSEEIVDLHLVNAIPRGFGLCKFKVFSQNPKLHVLELECVSVGSADLSSLMFFFQIAKVKMTTVFTFSIYDHNGYRIPKIVLTRSQIIDRETLETTMVITESVCQRSIGKFQSCPLYDLWIKDYDVTNVFFHSKESDFINFEDVKITIQQLQNILGERIIGHLHTVLRNFDPTVVVTFTGSNADKVLISENFNLRYHKPFKRIEISVNDNKVVSVLTISGGDIGNFYFHSTSVLDNFDFHSTSVLDNFDFHSTSVLDNFDFHSTSVLDIIPRIEQMTLNLQFEHFSYLPYDNYFTRVVEQIRDSAFKIFSVTIVYTGKIRNLKYFETYLYDKLNPTIILYCQGPVMI